MSNENRDEERKLVEQNEKIVWSIAGLGVLLLLVWFGCAYLMGQGVLSKTQLRYIMIASGCVVLLVALFAGTKLDKNAKAVDELKSE